MNPPGDPAALRRSYSAGELTESALADSWLAQLLTWYGEAAADVRIAEPNAMQVATVDVGGWDTHTNEVGELDRTLGSAAKSLAAFLTDLGPERRKRVTIAVMTEFGRRVAMNASGMPHISRKARLTIRPRRSRSINNTP